MTSSIPSDETEDHQPLSSGLDTPGLIKLTPSVSSRSTTTQQKHFKFLVYLPAALNKDCEPKEWQKKKKNALQESTF